MKAEYYQLFEEDDSFLYYASNKGYCFRCRKIEKSKANKYKNRIYIKEIINPIYKNNRYIIVTKNNEYNLKNLLGKMFLKEFFKGCHVVFKTSNHLDFSIENLKVKEDNKKLKNIYFYERNIQEKRG